MKQYFIRRQVHRLATFFLTKKCSVRGFRVTIVNSRPDIETDFVIERLEAALACYEKYMPNRYRHLNRDISSFWIGRHIYRGQFNTESRICILELSFVADKGFEVSDVAALIVHEAMHARLHARKFIYNPAVAARHERFCRNAELKFGELLPEGDYIRSRAASWLAMPDGEIAPINPDVKGRQRRKYFADLEALGAPAWFNRMSTRRWEAFEKSRDEKTEGE